MSEAGVEFLANRLEEIADYTAMEFDMSYAEMIGVIEIFKDSLMPRDEGEEEEAEDVRF